MLGANESLKAAVARVDHAFRAIRRGGGAVARSAIAAQPESRSAFLPGSGGLKAGINRSGFGALTANTWQTPLDLSYEIDLWGRVRRGFESARADAARPARRVSATYC